MIDNRPSRRSRKIKRILSAPVNVVVNTTIALRDAVYQTLEFVGIKGPGRRRRNRDFERAGRESPRVESVDEKAYNNLEQADKLRSREILNQVRYEKRTLRWQSEEAKKLRESMQNENLSVSQGDAISHLAKMNRMHAQKEKERKAKEKAEAEAKAEHEKAERQKLEREQAEKENEEIVEIIDLDDDDEIIEIIDIEDHENASHDSSSQF